MQGTQTVGRTEKPSGGDIPPVPPANSSPAIFVTDLQTRRAGLSASAELLVKVIAKKNFWLTFFVDTAYFCC